MKPITPSSFTCAKTRFRSPQIPTHERAPPLDANALRTPFSAQETASQRVFGNVDLFVLIAEQITVTSTLLHLFEAFETTWQAVEQMPKLILTALLNTLHLEIRQIAVAMLALESMKLSNSAERENFINTYLGHSDETLPELFNPVKAFVELRDIATAVETFEPLYVNACLDTLKEIEAARLARRPQCLPLQYDRCKPCWRWDGDEAKELSHDWERDPTGDRARRVYLRHLANTPFPWRFPAHPIEMYRIKRAFWRFELFCRLFPEKPTMDTGNDVELNGDRRIYLARLQKWECEEVTSVVPFLFRVLERIYDPAVFRNQANHVKRSRLQWKSFLTQAPMKRLRGMDEEPSAWQNECAWEYEIKFAAHGGREECSRLGYAGPDGNILNGLAAELSQQKWLAHQVSRGLRHILACHQQFMHDQGKVFSRHYPSQRYEPSQMYNAPVEALLRWHYRPWGQMEVEDHRLEEIITKHLRQWEDMPEAHVPSCCWTLRVSDRYFSRYDDLSLREVGYIFWDARN